MLKLRCVAAVTLVTLLICCSRGHAATPTDLLLKVTAPSFRVGVNGIYSVTVRNVGGAIADDTVTITDPLPAGLSFVSSRGNSWACSAAGQTVTCTNQGPINAGASSSVSLTVSVGTAAAPGVTNPFTVSYAADTNGSNNTATKVTFVKPGTVRGNPPTETPVFGTPTRTRTPTPLGPATPTPTAVATDLFLQKLSNRFFVVGSVGTYLLNVVNDGDAATNVPLVVTDTLPSGLGFVSASGPDWTCSNAGQTVTCINPKPLPVGASTSGITLLVSIGSAAYPSVTNVAIVDYPADTNFGNNLARRPTTVRRSGPIVPAATATSAAATPAHATATPLATRTRTPTPSHATATDILLTNTSSGSFRVGATGVYKLSVTNIGTATTNVPITVNDTLPDALRFVSAVGPGWTCEASGQIVSCLHPGAIISGGGAAISLDVNVSRAAFPTVTNTATAVYVGDINLSNNIAHRPTTVRQ